MCSQYWNLDTKITCPHCGKADLWNLQTHFMGYPGSCSHYYKLNEQVHELEGISVTLDGRNDDFSGGCEHCDKMFDIGAKIDHGEVKKVWILR